MARIFRRTPDVDKLPLLSIGEDIGAIKDGTDTDGLIGHLIFVIYPTSDFHKISGFQYN